MVPTTTVPTYNDAYSSLSGTYDPQTQLVQSEIDQLAPEQATQQASLDQAKVNAFKDINSDANSRGLLFSGFSPENQAIYTGTKYLPAVANLATTFQNNKNTLLDKINQINSTRATQAQGIVSTAQTAADKEAYDNAKLSSSSSGGITPYQQTELNSKAAAQYKVTGKSGYNGAGQKVTSSNLGYNFTGPNGTPISLAQYVQGSGGDANTVLSLLQNGSSYDKNIYNQVASNKSIQNNPTAVLSAIAKLDKNNYYGLQ